MRKIFYLTEAGVAKLQAERDELLAQRSQIVEDLKVARELGGLDENSEYISASRELEQAEGRILDIETILKNAKPIATPKTAKKVRLGSMITLRLKTGALKQFQVVSTVEADPLNGKISDESPLGEMLLGKSRDDQITMSTVSGTTVYTITDIH